MLETDTNTEEAEETEEAAAEEKQEDNRLNTELIKPRYKAHHPSY